MEDNYININTNYIKTNLNRINDNKGYCVCSLMRVIYMKYHCDNCSCDKISCQTYSLWKGLK